MFLSLLIKKQTKKIFYANVMKKNKVDINFVILFFAQSCSSILKHFHFVYVYFWLKTRIWFRVKNIKVHFF